MLCVERMGYIMETYLPILIVLITAFLGFFLNSVHNFKIKKREMVLSYLIEACSAIYDFVGNLDDI